MAISLVKGQKVQIQAQNPGLQQIGVGLGWDLKRHDTGADFDLDASVFMLGANGKIPSDGYFVFFNNTNSEDGSVIHTGDNRTGAGDGDDETIRVNLAKVNSQIQEIFFIVTIHEAESRKQNFGQVANSYIRVFNEGTGEEILKFELGEDFSTETAVTFGRLYLKDAQWRFEATGVGMRGGLDAYVNQYS